LQLYTEIVKEEDKLADMEEVRVVQSLAPAQDSLSVPGKYMIIVAIWLQGYK
jgi:hypothetical protein